MFTLAVAAVCALATTGCPSPKTVDVAEPGRIDGPDEPMPTYELLAKNRARHIEQLHAYWKAGVFPRNEEMTIIGNVFRDSAGHLCAAANLIKLDGYGELVDRTAKENNFIRLADVKEGELYQWILESGFTQEEIAMIQVPYMPIREISLEEERARLQERLAAVEARLRDDTEQSLAIAVRALESSQAARVAVRHPAEPVVMAKPPMQFATPPEPRL